MWRFDVDTIDLDFNVPWTLYFVNLKAGDWKSLSTKNLDIPSLHDTGIIYGHGMLVCLLFCPNDCCSQSEDMIQEIFFGLLDIFGP